MTRNAKYFIHNKSFKGNLELEMMYIQAEKNLHKLLGESSMFWTVLSIVSLFNFFQQKAPEIHVVYTIQYISTMCRKILCEFRLFTVFILHEVDYNFYFTDDSV